MKKTPIEVYDEFYSVQAAAVAHARREALEEAISRFTGSSFGQYEHPNVVLRSLLNASPGSGGQEPSTAGGQYGALSGSLENDAPASVPPATTNAAPQAPVSAGNDHPAAQRGSGQPAVSAPVWERCPSTHCNRREECASPSDCIVAEREARLRPAAAAPSGPSEEEVRIAQAFLRAYPSLNASADVLARAVLRWKEQSK